MINNNHKCKILLVRYRIMQSEKWKVHCIILSVLSIWIYYDNGGENRVYIKNH
ncbi:unnamed protein product [Spodoptera exigua]|nr:unnamed protein product [Spodoptera exigua]